MLRSHTCGELRADDLGREVTLCGWIDRVRDHKGVIFLDLRDRWVRTQVVIGPESPAATLAAARAVRSEWVVLVRGTVGARPEGVEQRLHQGERDFRARSEVAERSSPLGCRRNGERARPRTFLGRSGRRRCPKALKGKHRHACGGNGDT